MLSLKHVIRKSIAAVLAAAVASAVLVGCSNTSEPVETESAATTTTTEIAEVQTPDITDYDTFSIKYKYWYDNPDVAEAQASSLAELLNAPGVTLKGEAPNFPGVNLYSDADGNEFLVSGRTPIYLHPKLNLYELRLLRDSEGNRIYCMTEDNKNTTLAGVESIAEKVAEQPTTYEERVADSDLAKPDISGKYLAVNNSVTEYQFGSEWIPLTEIFNRYPEQFGNYTINESGATIVLYSASGYIKIDCTTQVDGVDFVYSIQSESATASDSEVKITADSILFTPDALEDFLGYDVEVYDEYVNIITDNKDLFSSSTILVSTEIGELIDRNAVLPEDYDYAAHPIPVSTPYTDESFIKEEVPPRTDDEIIAAIDEAQGTPNAPSMIDRHNADNAVKPETNKTPDGKYSLADTDLVNPDGTYTVKEYKAENLPTWCDEERSTEAWERLGKSFSANPSKIPYSEITLENAKDAFPFLGYVGEWPGYHMVLPTDSADIIARKVYNNLIGNRTPGYGDEPYYQYSSEAEHQAAIKHYEEEFAKREAEAAAADADREAVLRGEKHIGDGFSQEAIDNFFS